MAVVGLISCVSRKKAQAMEARDLYDSPLFMKARAYVEKQCDRWYVLSAKYGLVFPAQIIEPYEETLNKKPRDERAKWAQMVWNALSQHISTGDRIIVLAGERYRDHLVPLLIQHGCTVEVPMNGLGIGRQLHWLSKQLSQSDQERDLERLYCSIETLESGLGGKRLLSACSGQHDWPQNGIYLFFEPGERRQGREVPRIVRVGTHGVSRGSKATLWNRLRTHKGTGEGTGNHRGSIFRLHVGAALAARDPSLAVPTWGVDQSTDAEVRKREEHLERAVSQYIGAMSVLWLAIEGEAGPASDRAYLERNLIGLIVGRFGPIDAASPGWLGQFSPDERIRKSGLWNLDFLDYTYAREALDVLEAYVLVTIGKKPPPPKRLAPADWYAKERKGVSPGQLSLF